MLNKAQTKMNSLVEESSNVARITQRYIRPRYRDRMELRWKRPANFSDRRKAAFAPINIAEPPRYDKRDDKYEHARLYSREIPMNQRR